MEPMIAGLGPLFNDEKLGSLIDVNNKHDNWYYKNGKYFGDTYTGSSVSNPVRLPAQLPIAVLTGNQTGSSGEIVVISFIGNARTLTFGQPTWGLTTGNGDFALPDGSKIFLASTVMADRNGKRYTSSIVPDVQVEEKMVEGKDNVLQSAIDWIKSYR
jgi:C-terminal processing protease CtpA/Prc